MNYRAHTFLSFNVWIELCVDWEIHATDENSEDAYPALNSGCLRCKVKQGKIQMERNAVFFNNDVVRRQTTTTGNATSKHFTVGHIHIHIYVQR